MPQVEASLPSTKSNNMQSMQRSALVFVAFKIPQHRLPTAASHLHSIRGTKSMSGKLTGTTVVGQSGRQYVRTDLLKSDLRKPDLLNVYVAE